MPGEVVARESRDGFQVGRGDGAADTGIEGVTGPADGPPVMRRQRSPGGRRIGRGQRVGEIGNDLVGLQLFQGLVELAERRPDRGCKTPVGRDDVAHERQRTARAPERVVNKAGVHIENTIAKAAVGAGVAVMGFVRVQHEHLALHAVPGRPPIAEGLDAFERHADGVGVVPVRAERVPGEEGLEPLESRGRSGARRCGPDPVRCCRAARSFKTCRGALIHNGGHGLS